MSYQGSNASKYGASHFVSVDAFRINNMQENGKVPATKSPDVGKSIKVLF